MSVLDELGAVLYQIEKKKERQKQKLKKQES
jgi:hypothetical protein